jgi:hypothetical protein
MKFCNEDHKLSSGLEELPHLSLFSVTVVLKYAGVANLNKSAAAHWVYEHAHGYCKTGLFYFLKKIYCKEYFHMNQ